MGGAGKTGLEAAGGEGADGAVVGFFGGFYGFGHEFGQDGRSSLNAGVDKEVGAGGGLEWGLVGRAGGCVADLGGAVEEAFQVADGMTDLAEAGDEGQGGVLGVV